MVNGIIREETIIVVSAKNFSLLSSTPVSSLRLHEINNTVTKFKLIGKLLSNMLVFT